MDKRIVLGITGGVAAYKACELTRLCVKAGIEVDVVMTEAATHFVTPTTFQALSNRPVWTSPWDAREPKSMAHIELSRRAAGIVIVPASANFMAKLVHGIADDLLSTLCLARQPGSPLLVAPAMNVEMWLQTPTQRNVAQLREDGITVMGPGSGAQACGEVGDGRMLEPTQIFGYIEALFVPKVLQGKRFVITAGPTEEPIDPVRVITNTSSGKMGYSVAAAAAAAGAQVTLISGPTHLDTPAGVTKVSVKTAKDMFEAVKQAVTGADVFIAVAAVADYHVANYSERKIKKDERHPGLTLELEQNPDILAWAAQQKGLFSVGFAAESHDVLVNAEAKRKRKNIPLLVANKAQDAFGQDENEITLIDDAGRHPLPRGTKADLARQLIAHIAARVK
ncbi:MAG TPA: bifunctional phosphopantothenoylcysteine decarboxylase/phosphopantothenate--cysteine ligase CoaBC [Burkholderiales bacterium]